MVQSLDFSLSLSYASYHLHLEKSSQGIMLDEYKSKQEDAYKIRYCPVCNGEIKEPVAKFCYHCGSKLHNN